MTEQLIRENATLREQVEVLTQALAEAMVICAKWSPGGLGNLLEVVSVRNSATRAQFESECG